MWFRLLISCGGGLTQVETVYIAHVGEHEGKEVEIRGWLYNKRSSGSVVFLIVRDGTGFIQAVVAKGQVPE